MARESYIEQKSCLEMRKRGALDCLKIGWEGWPDRLILFGDNRHAWMEFKQEKGRLRAVQVERIDQMRKAGELVFCPRSVEEAVTCFEVAKRSLSVPG